MEHTGRSAIVLVDIKLLPAPPRNNHDMFSYSVTSLDNGSQQGLLPYLDNFTRPELMHTDTNVSARTAGRRTTTDRNGTMYRRQGNTSQVQDDGSSEESYSDERGRSVSVRRSHGRRREKERKREAEKERFRRETALKDDELLRKNEMLKKARRIIFVST
jgi:hypothetical protein